MAALGASLATVQSQLAAKTTEATQLNSELAAARNSLASLQGQLDAAQGRLLDYVALQTAIGVLKREIAKL